MSFHIDNVKVCMLETFSLTSILLILYFLRSIIDTYVLILFSIILFIVVYNVYVLRAFKVSILLPLWLFPLAWSLSLITSLFLNQSYVLLIYYFAMVLGTSIVSKQRIVSRILSFHKYFVFIFLLLAFLFMIYSPEYRAWVSLGCFVEYFVASYFYLEYGSNYNSLDKLDKNVYISIVSLIIAGLVSLLSSLIIFIKPWMVMYGFIINFAKVLSLKSININAVSVLMIIDLFIRFLLIGGITWITGIL